jgi:hypothetical protein
MVEYSYDPDDTRFLDEEQRMFFEDVEFIKERQEPERSRYERDRPERTYRSEGIDSPDQVPLWWIEFRGRQRLIETFSDGDEDYLGDSERVKLTSSFRFFRTNERFNHWF